MHYGDPHDRYKLHPESPVFGRKGRDLYDNEIHFTDMHIQKLLDFCAQQPWWNDTVVIISSDHGEAFGEHDQFLPSPHAPTISAQASRSSPRSSETSSILFGSCSAVASIRCRRQKA